MVFDGAINPAKLINASISITVSEIKRGWEQHRPTTIRTRFFNRTEILLGFSAHQVPSSSPHVLEYFHLFRYIRVKHSRNVHHPSRTKFYNRAEILLEFSNH